MPVKEKIRVLYIIGAMNRGGAETMIMNLLRHFDLDAFQVDFLLNVRSINPQPGGDYHEEILSLGCRLFTTTTQTESGILRYVKDFQRIYSSNGGYDIIHTHLDILNGVIALAARKAGCKNVIVHAHRSSLTWKKPSVIKFYAALFQKSLIYRYATNCWACSKFAGEFLFPHRKYIIINNSINTEAFQNIAGEKSAHLRKELLADSHGLLIVNVAKIHSVKNQLFLLDVARVFRQRGKDVHFVLIGSDNSQYAKNFKAKCRASGLDGQFHLLGVRSDIPELLTACDVYVMPSISEGLPVTSIEAQAVGMPAIFSANITRELDMGLGLATFLPIDSPEAWADAISKAAATPRIDWLQTREAIIKKGYDARTNATYVMEQYRNICFPPGKSLMQED